MEVFNLKGYCWNPQIVNFRYTAEFPCMRTPMRWEKQMFAKTLYLLGIAAVGHSPDEQVAGAKHSGIRKKYPGMVIGLPLEQAQSA